MERLFFQTYSKCSDEQLFSQETRKHPGYRSPLVYEKTKSMRKNELLFKLLLQYFFRYSRDASWSAPTLHISQRLKMFSALPSEPSRFVTPNKFVCAAEIHFE